MVQAGFVRISLRRPGLNTMASLLRYVVEQATLGQFFLGYFRFPCQYQCHQGYTLTLYNPST